MQVIGAGFMRTGTLSTKAALEILGYPCYHMKEILKNKGHIDVWHKLMADQVPIDWNVLFHEFEATVDTPICIYYKELMQTFPDAKVLLTLREQDRWYASLVTLHTTIDKLRPIARVIPKLGKMVRFVDIMFDKIFGGSLQRENCIRVFNEHNAEVQKFVPPERLLVFRVTDGWEPLCEFLGCDVPEATPFPHLNEGEQTIKSLILKYFVGPWVKLIALTAIGLAILIWWLL